jgi:hypothetical protein
MYVLNAFGEKDNMASDLRLGGIGVGACPSRVTVLLLGPFSPLLAACFGWFLLSVVCFFLFFLGHSLLVFGSNFMRIFVG